MKRVPHVVVGQLEAINYYLYDQSGSSGKIDLKEVKIVVFDEVSNGGSEYWGGVPTAMERSGRREGGGGEEGKAISMMEGNELRW